MPSSPPRSPSIESPPERASLRSRMASIQDNVRSLLRASIHSITPATASSHGSPKLRIPVPSLQSRFRWQSRENDTTQLPSARSSAQPSEPHTAAIPIHEHAPIIIPSPPEPTYLTRVVTPHDSYPEDSTEERSHHSRTALIQDRTRQRHQKAWKRRRGVGGRHNRSSRKRDPKARALKQAILLSGLLLVAVLSLYLSLALTNPNLGQEIHVLFILLILTITIFFAHSLVRLCLCTSRSRRSRRHHHHHHHSASRRLPSMTGPEGFRPDTPIQVHLQRDEELGPASEFDTSPEIPSPITPPDNRTFEGLLQKETSTKIEGPPPAYGLWRSSVKADPNLLHWQLNPNPIPSPNPTNLHISISAESSPAIPQHGTGSHSPRLNLHPGVSDGAGTGSDVTPVPRPPSYVSEDGVTYVVDAMGRRPEMAQRG